MLSKDEWAKALGYSRDASNQLQPFELPTDIA